MDSVGILDAASTSRSYAAFTYSDGTGTIIISGVPRLFRLRFVPGSNYVGRINENVGLVGTQVPASDWLASVASGGSIASLESFEVPRRARVSGVQH